MTNKDLACISLGALVGLLIGLMAYVGVDSSAYDDGYNKGYEWGYKVADDLHTKAPHAIHSGNQIAE